MTTIIYKKWKYLAWDRKFVWWINWDWLETKISEIQIISNNVTNKIIYWSSWIFILQLKLEDIIINAFKDWYDIRNIHLQLYNIKSELEKYTDWDFWLILIINWVWYYIQKSHCEWITSDFVAFWSWWNYALWIQWLDNEVDLWVLFEVVSRLDSHTSKEFDIINL